MDLKILILILAYWTFFIALLSIAGSTILTDEGLTATADFNETALSINETDRGGLFGTGVSFGRFFGIAIFGIGLPSSYPSLLKLLFGLWQTMWTVFTIGFILSSIWNG